MQKTIVYCIVVDFFFLLIILFVVYIHPFDDPMLWTGHSTMIEEIFSDIPQLNIPDNKPDIIVTVVGGGGIYTSFLFFFCCCCRCCCQ